MSPAPYAKGARVIVTTANLGDQPGRIGNSDPAESYIVLDHGGGNTYANERIREDPTP